MKKPLALWLLLFLLSGSSFAKDVPPEQAASIAKSFITQFFTTDSLAPAQPADLRLIYTRNATLSAPDAPAENNSYYIFEFTDKEGFIIISADDQVYPVLGFSSQSGFDPERVNPALRKWLDEYHRQIQHVIEAEIPATPDIQAVWQALESGNPLKSTGKLKSVGPLIQSRWDQSPYFNDMCPYDNNYNERTVSGCVATAMAQILKYWNYPEKGTGFHTYHHKEYGAQSANFGATTYNWAQMGNRVSTTNDAVATLLYHVGVSVEMDYGVNGSSAATFEYSEGLHSGEYALKNYFGYKESLYGASRENYTDQQWSQLLRNELDDGRPLLYRGSGTGGGHAFVCDGYTDESFFHFNWGWGGYQDGYFHMDALNPGGVGTGGGSGGFNSYHMAGIGVEPPAQNTTYDLRLFDHMTVEPNPLAYGNSFSVHLDVANFGQAGFTGDFCIAMFDSDVNFVDFVEIKSNWALESGYHYTDGVTFENVGSFTFLPGDYILTAMYKPTGENWKLIEDDADYTNIKDFTIQHANDIELYAEMTLQPGPEIIQGRAFTVHLDIANAGSADFTGTVDVSLYDLEGQFVETIEEISGISLESGYHFSNGLDFSTNEVTAEPATYLLALQYHTTDGDWELAGSSYQTNPVQVIVKVAPLMPDAFENNNTADNPYVFYPSYTNNQYAFTTSGSSIHTEEDVDYYAIYLEGGYTYYLTGRLHDEYSSTNGQEYSNDCLISLSVDDYSSDVYDDVLPEFQITAYSNGLAILHVTSYFEGDKGTYLLDAQIRREYGTGIQDQPLVNDLVVFPNPVTNHLFVQLPDKTGPAIGKLEIINQMGQVLMKKELNGLTENQIKIDTRSLSPGNYTIRIESEEILTQKFIKL